MDALSMESSSGAVRGAAGPLRVCRENPRYFADAGGKPVYLTGSHTWRNFKDMGMTDPPAVFDFEAYLEFLTAHHHNCFRLWAWELTRGATGERRERLYVRPFAWPRTGPGQALDGK